MNYKVLYRKYRPDNFDKITGQDHIITTLKNSIKNGKISHAYIFTGPRGTGKTTTAKVFAKTVNCENIDDGNACDKCFQCQNFNESQDIIEIDAASNNGVDEIRELRNNVKLSPSNSKYKIYIIDEVHMLSTEAFNALLKTLEEPPKHVIFILATTDIQKVPLTILSRCQRFDFKRITPQVVEDYLRRICEKENIKIEDDALKEISIICDGGMRDALSILDQLVIDNESTITLKNVNNVIGNVSNVIIDKLIKFLIENNLKEVCKILDSFKENGTDSKIFVEKLIKVLVDKAIDYKFSQSDIKMFERLRNLINSLVKGLSDLKNTSNPYLIIKLLLADFIKIDQENKIVNEKISEIKNETKIKIEETIKNDEKNIELEQKEEKDDSIQKKIEKPHNFISREIISVRINNCFCKATKKDLLNVKKLWEIIKKSAKENRKDLISLILDSEVVAASDGYAIVKVNDDSQSLLFNKDVKKLEEYFNDINKTNYKLVSLTTEEWKIEKQKYIENINNKIVYEMQEEISSEEEKSDIENTILDIFENDKIIVK